MDHLQKMQANHEMEMAKLKRDLDFWRHAQVFAYAILAIFLACLSVYALSGCSTAQPESEPPFIGAWEAEGPGGKVFMRFDADHSYSALLQLQSDTTSETGEWTWREPYLITSPTECRNGFAPLMLIACTGPDSVRVSIEGDVWPIRFSATEVTTFHRVHHK